MDYKVLRPHLGDKPYQPGDVRSAKAATVSHLVAKGVLKPADQEDPKDDERQQVAPENKADAPPDVPAEKPGAELAGQDETKD